jgi:hypothetical protein
MSRWLLIPALLLLGGCATERVHRIGSEAQAGGYECRTGSDGVQGCGYGCKYGSDGHWYCATSADGRCAYNIDGTWSCP